MDPRYATSPGHVRNRTGLITTLDKTPQRARDQPAHRGRRPVAQINHVGAAEHPQVRARAMAQHVHHPEAGTLWLNPLLDLGGRQGWWDAG